MKKLSIFLIYFLSFEAARAAGPCEEAMLAPFLSTHLVEVSQAAFPERAFGDAKAKLDADLNAVLALSPGERTFANTVLAVEKAADQFTQTMFAILNVIDTTYPAERQTEKEEFEQKVSRVTSGFNLNRDLYLAMKDQVPRSKSEKALLAHYRRVFEDSGVGLDENVRGLVQTISEDLDKLTSRFFEVVRNDVGAVALQQSDLVGQSPELVKGLTRDESGYLLATNQSRVVATFLREATDSSARKKVYRAFRSRAPENIDNLLQMVHLLIEKSKLKKATGALDGLISPHSLASNRDEVKRVLNDLVTRLRPTMQARLAELKLLKQKKEPGMEFHPSDVFHYEALINSQSQLKDGGVQARPGNVEKYFPAPRMLDRVFTLYGRLYGLKVIPRPDLSGIHSSVNVVEVRKSSGEPLGFLYIDLFAREEKMTGTNRVAGLARPTHGSHHATAYMALSLGKEMDFGQRGMNFSEIKLLMHETGHALHSLLAKAEFGSLWGFERTYDFLEIPSMLGEELVHDPKVLRELSGLAKNEKRKLPWAMARAMVERNNGFSYANSSQVSPTYLHHSIFLAWLDMKIFDRSKAFESPAELNQMYRDAFKDFYGMEADPEDQFPQSFFHVAVGYAGNYYSYVWSQIAVAHIVQRLRERGGLDNPSATFELVTKLLEPSQATNSKEALEDYLGGPLDPGPYLERFR